MSSIFSKDFKSELTPGKITAQVLVTFFVAFVAFSFESISRLILHLYKDFSQTLYDSLIQSVASGQKDYSLEIYKILILLFLVIVFWAAMILKQKASKILVQAGVQLPSKAKTTETRISNLKRVKLALNIYMLMIIILFLVELIRTSLQTSRENMRREFERKIKIISPYIDNKHKERIISDFSLMKKEYDYNKINFELDTLFIRNKLNP